MFATYENSSINYSKQNKSLATLGKTAPLA